MMRRRPGARKRPGCAPLAGLRLWPARRPGAWRVMAVVVGLLAAGCPKRFDPRADTLAGLSSARAADPAIDAAWRDARAQLDRGELASARDGFRKLRERGGPAAAPAALWEARSELELGQPAAARVLVEPLVGDRGDPQVDLRARFLLGLALARQGEAARARELLLPLEPVIAGGDDAAELHASLASAAASLGEVPAALDELERFFAEARPAERSWIRAEATRLAATLGDADARALFEVTAPGSLARAVLAGGLAARVADPAGARSIADDARNARERFGFSVAAERGGGAVVRAVGLVLPLSGKNRLLGERALRGALMGAGVLPPENAGLELRVRDSASRPDRAAAAVDELAREGVAAIVLSPDRAEAAAAGARAEQLGLPVLDLSPDETPGARFRLLRPSVARAAALAAEAVRLGARRCATFYPDNAYGRKMAEAFAAAVQARGGVVVAQLHFDEKTTTFIAQARQLAAQKPDAIFVPASAGQLELIAAQLATLGVTGARAGRPGALLCATADGAGSRMLARAGRYLQGALLAPVFYLGNDDRSASVVEAYRSVFSEEPGAADALAHDALAATRAALARVPGGHELGRDGRRQLASQLASGRLAGLTGPIAFARDGERTGPPSLYTVEGDHVKALP